MYAIVEIAGQQFKVEKDQQVFVHRLEGKEGDKVDFHDVLLIDNGGKVAVGAPAIEGAMVSAEILRHLKGDKVIVFKKKRRKGYKVRNGHRQYFTEIKISGISEKGGKKPAASKKAEPKKEDEPEVSDNLVTRAENRAEEQDIDVNVEKLLNNIGTALKADIQDLKKINGIGPAFEEKLNTIGIYTYEQIANMKVADIRLLSKISGVTEDKVRSEEWVKQAKALVKEENK